MLVVKIGQCSNDTQLLLDGVDLIKTMAVKRVVIEAEANEMTKVQIEAYADAVEAKANDPEIITVERPKNG